MPDRYTTEEAGATLGVTPARVNQLARDLGIEPEKIGRANFFSLPQIKRMEKWLSENGYKISSRRREEIARLYATGRHLQRELAERFGITGARVGQIVKEQRGKK